MLIEVKAAGVLLNTTYIEFQNVYKYRVPMLQLKLKSVILTAHLRSDSGNFGQTFITFLNPHIPVLQPSLPILYKTPNQRPVFVACLWFLFEVYKFSSLLLLSERVDYVHTIFFKLTHSHLMSNRGLRIAPRCTVFMNTRSPFLKQTHHFNAIP